MKIQNNLIVQNQMIIIIIALMVLARWRLEVAGGGSCSLPSFVCCLSKTLGTELSVVCWFIEGIVLMKRIRAKSNQNKIERNESPSEEQNRRNESPLKKPSPLIRFA